MLQYILDNLLPLGIALSGAIAWIFDKRKRKAELQSVITQNKQAEATALSGMQDVYDHFVEDVKSQLEDLRQENSNLKKRVSELELQLSSVEEERAELTHQLSMFKEQSKKDGEVIAELKLQVDGYEKELKSFRKERK